ncbi:MAG: sensor histidine kinase [Ruminococcus sp.]|nr:sensor histidine kinase [Ruminococcus sp.]
MSRLIDKATVLFICAIAFGMADSFSAPVVGLLVSMTLSGLVQIFTGKPAASVMIAAAAAACVPFPIMLCALPLMLLDSLNERRPWLLLPAVFAVKSALSIPVSGLLVIAAGCAVSLLLYLRVSALEKTVSRMTSLRDEAAERNISLSRQNQLLSEAQDNEVRLATLSERNRIAREIHDNVGHMLTRSLLQSGALMVINKDENLAEPLKSLHDTIDSAMTSIRASVHDLHDDSVDLRRIIEESAASVSDRFTTEIRYDVSAEMPGRLRFCIAGVVREALSNAVKHSAGDRIRITMLEHPAFYQLLVEDNGKCSEIGETGIGLSNMTDRARSVGGTISFTPSDKGFRVFMSIPKAQEDL